MEADIEWRASHRPVPYPEAVAELEARMAAVAAGGARELVWLLEHPPVYTAGTSADPSELIEARFPVFASGRGGRHTYHGPGQRIAWAIIDLARRDARDVRRYVAALEAWAIEALAGFGVAARTAPGRVGIWVDDRDGRESKIGAIGVRIRRWATGHGMAINLAPDLDHFGGIVPCGLPDYPVTSLAQLGVQVGTTEWDSALRAGLPRFLARLADCADLPDGGSNACAQC